MTQTEFNYEEGQAARDAGLDRASNPFYRRELLKKAREIAREIAPLHWSSGITYDDVYEVMLNRGLSPELLGSAAGAVFRGDDWYDCGWRQSHRVSNHARAMRVWRLK